MPMEQPARVGAIGRRNFLDHCTPDDHAGRQQRAFTSCIDLLPVSGIINTRHLRIDMTKRLPATKQVQYRMVRLTEADIAAVMQIDREGFTLGRRKAEAGYKACIEDRAKHGEVHVVRNALDDIVVGYVHFKRQRDATIFLCNMATGLQHRGQGVAAFGLCWLRQFSIDDKVKRILLHVRAANKGAIRRYGDSGYVETKRQALGYAAGKREERTKVTMELQLPV